VQRAIDFEVKRQITAIENGETLYMETRNFDAMKGITLTMRSKEGASDYRYFPEPDLPPLHITPQFIEGVKEQMPELPKTLYIKFTENLGLSEYDAQIITENKDMAAYFEAILKHTGNTKAAANWLMVNIKGYLNDQAIHINDFVLQPAKIAEIIALIDGNKISNSAASQRLFPAMIEDHHKSALQIAEALNLLQESNEDELQKWINDALAKFPEKVLDYKAGKHNLLGLFMGEVMKASKGKADPKLATQLLKETLEK
jgi:aspartyl-tRNA(Asn)/glutamyl-tRNA(Gln) amidotransferase subunit B